MSPRFKFVVRTCAGLLPGILPLFGGDLVTNQALQLRHPAGFLVTQFAAPPQAHDVRSITFDTQGKLFASGRGWIRSYVDEDKDGKAEKVSLFAATSSGASGMVFVGNDLYAVADGYFCRYLDSNGDGVADGGPQRFFEIASGEKGGHSLRRGPDGAWYIITGPEARLGPALWNHVGSPIRNPSGGSIIHISPDLSRSEIVADGILNAEDFDFHPSGALFFPDAAFMEDAFMPWHAGSRLFHMAHGSDHGWGEGAARPWGTPDYYPDAVPVLWFLLGNRPSAIEFYRHHQFPKVYRNGAFVGDWEHGQILHVAPKLTQSSFTTAVNLFMEPVGDSGFSPRDMAVAPDGSLMIASGGRGTEGGIYQVKYVQVNPETGRLPDQPAPYLSDVDRVLRAPQRLEAWSRQQWMPLAAQQGRKIFEEVAMSLNDPEEYKLVAVDVLTEIYGGLNQWVANGTANSPFESVRARTAWSLSRFSYPGYLQQLHTLAMDTSPFVRRAALDTFLDHVKNLPAADLLRAAVPNLVNEDQRVREAAIAIVARLPDAAWLPLAQSAKKETPMHRLSLALAATLRPDAATNEFAVNQALDVLRKPEEGTPLLGLMALRVIMRSQGDWDLDNPVESSVPFRLRRSAFTRPAELADALRPLIPTGNAFFNAEVARVLGMLEDGHPDTPGRIMMLFNQQNPAAVDIHFLDAIAHLDLQTAPANIKDLSEVLLWLDDKTGQTRFLPVQEWQPRVLEIATTLIRKQPIIGSALMNHPKFARPEHAWLVRALQPAQQRLARSLFLTALEGESNPVWTPELIELIGHDASPDWISRIREQWKNGALRAAIIRVLAENPDPADRSYFIQGLSGTDPVTLLAAVRGLTKIEEEKPDEVVGYMMQVLYRAAVRPEWRELREAIVTWLAQKADFKQGVMEFDTDPRSLELAYMPVFAWFAQTYPLVAAQVAGMDREALEFWMEQIRTAPYASGKVALGKKLYDQHACNECHGSGVGYGPDLVGVAERHTPAGLMRTIVFPHLDVEPQYAIRQVTTKAGARHVGMAVFESPETLILQTEKGRTIRLRQTDIVSRVITHDSSMPVGLLKRTNARDLADLYAYLKSLR